MPHRTLVLTVDDDADFRLQARVALEAAGFAVVEAATQAEARARLGDTPFALAILDLMMEDVDAGFALCHAVKRARPAAPVLLVSGVTRETGLRFGTATAEERSWIKADAFLAMPVRPEQLVREAMRLLAGERADARG